LLGSEEPGGLFKIHGGSAHRAAKILEKIAEATGGQAYLPKSLEEVGGTCEQVAHDIRNQYTLAYYPSNARKDGTFRGVRIDAFAPGSHTKLAVRTRPGYFAPNPNAPAAVTSVR
jgi:VWFA-related protein